MPRPEKVAAVAEIKERIERARAVFLAEYAGLSMKDQQTLRRGLRAKGAEFKVFKMTLARRAASELELADLDELLLGPTGLAFADDDAVSAAKALRDFARDHEVFKVKGGLLGKDYLTPERVSDLATIEPREVLLARLAGGLQAPLAKTAALLAAMPRSLASMLSQLIDKKPLAAPEASNAEPPAEEATGAEPEAEAAGTDADDTAAPEDPAAEAAETAGEAAADESETDSVPAAEPTAAAEGSGEATSEETDENHETAEQAEEE
jgi:large subunit ribosomal protein L10